MLLLGLPLINPPKKQAEHAWRRLLQGFTHMLRKQMDHMLVFPKVYPKSVVPGKAKQKKTGLPQQPGFEFSFLDFTDRDLFRSRQSVQTVF